MLEHGKGESTGMEEVHMKTEAETGVMPSQAQELQGDQKLQETKEAPPLEHLERVCPCPHLNFRLLTTVTSVREYTSFGLS